MAAQDGGNIIGDLGEGEGEEELSSLEVAELEEEAHLGGHRAEVGTGGLLGLGEGEVVLLLVGVKAGRA